ncbi:MAG: tetratricopeptide repeat protein [Bacteroidetes bacterium]|nr:tetratricopeptide repeat protein [Bacteroidota bacterium]
MLMNKKFLGVPLGFPLDEGGKFRLCETGGCPRVGLFAAIPDQSVRGFPLLSLTQIQNCSFNFCVLFFSLIFSLPSFSQINKKIDSLKRVLEITAVDSTKTNLYHAIAWQYLEINLDSAMLYDGKGLALAKKIGFAKREAYLLDLEGYINLYKSDFEKAIQLHIDALKLHEKLGDKMGSTRSINGIGFVYDMQGNYDKAIDYYQQSLTILKELKSDLGIASSLNYIGNIYRKKKDYQTSLKYLFNGLKVIEKNPDPEFRASAYYEISNTYFESGQLDSSIKYALKVTKIYESMKDTMAGRYADMLNTIGSIYKKQGKYEQAIKICNASFLKAKKIGIIDVMKEASRTLSESYSNIKDFQNAYNFQSIYSKIKDSTSTGSQVAQLEAKFLKEKNDALHKKEIEHHEQIAKEENYRKNIIIWSVVAGLFLIILFSIFILNRWRITNRQKSIIEKQKLIVDEQRKLVEEKNKDITDSINYAQRIQRALLASDSLLAPALKGEFAQDYFILFKPKDIVSGDFYWATKVSSPNGGGQEGARFYLAVCDSTGHGVPGAFMSLLNISFLNEAINEEGLIQPNEIFNHVRQRLIQNISQDGGKDGMDGILIQLEIKNEKLKIEYAAAHNAPILIQDGKLIELDADNMPVGLSDRKNSFTLRAVEPQTSDLKPQTLYLYTDGFADQFGGPKGKKFKYKPLNDLLSVNSNKPMNEQKLILEKTFEDWKGNLEQVDDLLIIGIKI